MMRQPQIWPRPVKCTSIHLPKREELLLRTVLALPKASSTGFAASSLSCMLPSELPAASAKNLRQCLVASVLPAPDSPEMMMLWSRRSPRRPRYAEAAVWNTCGSEASPGVELRCSVTCSGVYTLMRLKGLSATRMEPMLV